MEVIQLVNKALTAALLAGIEIRNVYSLVDFNIQLKEDNTPVTIADEKANKAIFQVLKSTNLPILSEESIPANYPERKNWEFFWMVDPLDGTKEFIKRNDEFTVNIALINRDKVIAGVVYAPVTGEMYVGIQEIGAWKLMNPDENCTFEFMQQAGEKLSGENKSGEYIVTISRSHQNAATEKYIENLRRDHQTVKTVSKGSSLKICMVAEGSANIYPKLGPTMEWDTAAGHAIAKAAGKNIFHTDRETEISYNKENLLNPHFIVL
ncbi:MAG: 3'(2'),5'-bisphosphate nucleotidase CysQ [Prolixibacteraceae bacterium]|jgi:3'(2'), 5'-bisphosphate nucleotidase